MKKIILLFIMLFTLFSVTACQMGGTGGTTNPHTHKYVEGVCSCGKADPDYVEHEHVFVDGVCSCGAEEENNNPKEFTISYELDGGEFETDPTIKFSDGSRVELISPVKEGYLFLGWYNEDNEEVKNLAGIFDDVTLYAKWVEFTAGVEYQIEYVLNGGVLEEDAEYSYISGSEYQLPTPHKPGYDFKGWFDYNTDEAITVITDITSGDIKVYALYEKVTKVCDITYHVDGGILPDTTKYTYTEGVGQGLPKPTKEGYYFRGWYKDSEYTKVITAITVTYYGDLELYAKWEEASIENSNIAFLGDSITTFYSETSPFNSLFGGNNQFYYPIYSQTVSSVTQTWWYKTVQAVGGNLFVNNSYSGGTVCGSGMSAAVTNERLAKFNYKGQTPDVIIIYLGINDAVGKTPANTFKETYQTMIDKIQNLYSGVQIFICNLPYETYTDGTYREQYNVVLSELAEENNLPLINFKNAWSSATEQKDNWKYLGDNIHPSASGMTVLANIATKAIKEFYGIE